MSTKKRLLLLAIVAALLFSLFSCADKEVPADSLFTHESETERSPESKPDPAPTESTPSETTPAEIDWSPISEDASTSTDANDNPTEITEVIPIFGEPDTEQPYVPQPAPSYVPPEGGIAPLALMYHLILDEPYSSLESLFVRPSELKGHIEALLDKGYTFIFADEYAYSDQKTVIMSFDDGYLDNYTEMFPIIKQYNVKVTVFMISNYVGGADYLTADMIKEMAASGLVSFQSHTATHQAVPSLTEDQMRFEFETSNKALEALTGRKVTAFCYPTGAYDARSVSIVKDYYDFAYTTVSMNSTAGFSVYELPRLRVQRGLSKDAFSSMIP